MVTPGVSLQADTAAQGLHRGGTRPVRLRLCSQTGKWLRLAWQLVRGAWTVRVHFGRLDAAQRGRVVQQWARQTLAVMELHVQADAPLAQDLAGLVVCNHLSWLDVLVMQSLLPVTFVAKREVRHWPLIGYLARGAGTVFVDRARARSAQAMVERTADAMRQGQAVVVFPEGTSSDGSQLGRFHANIFESALRARAPVHTLALQYRQAASDTPAAAAHFIGDMGFLTSMRQVMATPGMRAMLSIGECIASEGHSRKSLALHAQASVNKQLVHLQSAQGTRHAETS